MHSAHRSDRGQAIRLAVLTEDELRAIVRDELAAVRLDATPYIRERDYAARFGEGWTSACSAAKKAGELRYIGRARAIRAAWLASWIEARKPRQVATGGDIAEDYRAIVASRKAANR